MLDTFEAIPQIYLNDLNTALLSCNMEGSV